MGMNTFMRISAQKGPTSTKNSIGFDEDTLMKEFERAFKELKLVKDSVSTKDIRRIQRQSLKPMVKKFRDAIKDEQDVTVYRNGGIYAEIPKGTLKKSIGIITSPVRKKQTFSQLSVGARVKGKFSDPEKGGWFAHFVEYGFINSFGQYVKGGNYEFAEKAKKGGLSMVRNTFKNLMRAFVDAKVKASIK
jgi:hypothetical protein